MAASWLHHGYLLSEALEKVDFPRVLQSGLKSADEILVPGPSIT